MAQAIALTQAIMMIRKAQAGQPTAIFNMLYRAERHLDKELAAELKAA